MVRRRDSRDLRHWRIEEIHSIIKVVGASPRGHERGLRCPTSPKANESRNRARPPPVDPGSRPYPVELECDVITNTGATLHMRPIRPEDAEPLVHFHLNLSSGAIYRRYFCSTPSSRRRKSSISPRLTTLTAWHSSSRTATSWWPWVVTTGFRATEAEVAFLVADQYQHHGLGLLLLKQLADAARPLGSRTSPRRPRPTTGACSGSSMNWAFR